MKILEGLDLKDFDLHPSDYNVDQENKEIVITKKNWDYLKSLELQEILVERIWNNKDERALIFCSHPHCFTLGKGLQKTREADKNLIDFNEQLIDVLPFPVHKISRGGGITFHYPGQLVFYPIMSLEKHKLRVFDFLKNVLKMTKYSLEQLYSLNDLECDRELLGLWHKENKIASIGLSAKRFVSYHGLALNLINDQKMNNALKQVFPCGLPGHIYKSIDQLIEDKKSDQYFDTIKASILNQI